MPDPPVLKMTAGQYERLRNTLLTPCGRERKLYAELGETAKGYVVRRLLVPEDRDYARRTPSFVLIRPEWMMRTIRAFAETDAAGVLEAHSHPFCRQADFSATDDEYITEVREDFERKRPGCAFLRLVVACREDGFSLQIFDPGVAAFVQTHEIVVVGELGIRTIRSFLSPTKSISRTVGPAYARVAAVRTAEEHERMTAARGVVVGAGGTGWLTAQLLGCLGVGHLTLVDGDAIEQLNLNRLVGATQADVQQSRPKVDRLATIIQEQDPAHTVVAIAEGFPSAPSIEAVQRADFVVCAVDDPPTRLDVLRLCARHLVPALDVGSGIYLTEAREREAERHAHAWLYVPGEACWLHMGLQQQAIGSKTLREARRAAGYVVDDPRESPGSVQTLNATIVSVGLSLLEAYLIGRKPAYNVILYEERVAPAWNCRLRQYRVAPHKECLVCGPDGFVGHGGNPFVGCAANGMELDLLVPAALLDDDGRQLGGLQA